MIVTDTSRLESVTPAYSGIDVTKKYEELFYILKDLKHEIAQTSMHLVELQQKEKEIQKLFSMLEPLVVAKCSHKEIEEIKEEVNLQINNPDDYRNKH